MCKKTENLYNNDMRCTTRHKDSFYHQTSELIIEQDFCLHNMHRQTRRLLLFEDLTFSFLCNTPVKNLLLYSVCKNATKQDGC